MGEQYTHLGPDERHERGCPGRYGATPDGLPDSDERSARCQCHLKVGKMNSGTNGGSGTNGCSGPLPPTTDTKP